jgi:hypothetical protein
MQLAALRVMCHMAATPAGRSCIAAASCLPRWLCSAGDQQLQQQTMLLMVALSCMTDWTAAVYWAVLEEASQGRVVEKQLLPFDGMDIEAYRKSCPPVIRQQVACPPWTCAEYTVVGKPE